jgi:hypothetical protein
MNNFIEINPLQTSCIIGGNKCVVEVTITHPADETKATKINELSKVLDGYNNDFSLFQRNMGKATTDIGVNIKWKANCLSNPVTFVVK